MLFMIKPHKMDAILNAYDMAKQRYAALGVDTDLVIQEIQTIPVSLHCWQGDDVRGFEQLENVVSQNMVTGSYPGAARNADELRRDIEQAFQLSPCKHRVNLHSMYAEPAKPKERNALTADDFSHWIQWAKEKGLGLDFNASFFTHPMLNSGFSLSSRDAAVRDYWVQAGIGARQIADQIGRDLGTPCINNIWIPDGMKDIPANRMIYRQNLLDSLNRILEEHYERAHMMDVLEGKLFGIGLESFTVGSHEFYLAFAASHGVGVCMDTGHYHPTESVADKVSAVIPFVDPIMLHVIRGIRWDSDHVLIQSDELTGLMLEVKRAGLFHKVHIGLDYFDASINRVAAWVIGLRAVGKAMLTALLEPSHLLEEAEANGDYTARLALMEEMKNLPVNAVWERLCLQTGCPIGAAWMEDIREYEQSVLSKR